MAKRSKKRSKQDPSSDEIYRNENGAHFQSTCPPIDRRNHRREQQQIANQPDRQLNSRQNSQILTAIRKIPLWNFLAMAWQDVYLNVAVCILSVIIYWPCLMRIENEFVYDDEVAVTSHPYIGINNNTLREDLKGILTSDFWGQNIHDPQSHKSYRPLVSLFFYFEHKIYSTTHKASYMKRWTMVFHALLCCLLNFLLKRIFRDHHMIKLAVLLFSVHPIHVEAIGSVVGRADVMCALGLLGFIAHYFDYIVIQNRKLTDENDFEFRSDEEVVNDRRRIPTRDELNSEATNRANDQEALASLSSWFWFLWIRSKIFVYAICCVLCKETGIMAFPLAITLDLLINFRPVRLRTWKWKTDFIKRVARRMYITDARIINRTAWSILSFLIIVFLRGLIVNFELPTFTADENPIAAQPNFVYRTLSISYSHALNFWLLVFPDWLACDWSYGSFRLVESVFDIRIIFAPFIYYYLINRFIRGPSSVRKAIAFLVIPFLPSSHTFVTVGFVLADRALYFPSLGFCLLVAIGMRYLLKNQSKNVKNIIYGAYVCVIFIFIWRSYQRATEWTNNYELFKSALNVVPNNSKMYYNLGTVTARNGDYKLSVEYSLKANELHPHDLHTLNNMGNAYRKLGDPRTAVKYLTEAVELDPKYVSGWMNLAIAYVEYGAFKKALFAYQKADALRPNDYKITFNTANLYVRMGKRNLADSAYQKALALEPLNPDAMSNFITFLSLYGTEQRLIGTIDLAIQAHRSNPKVLLIIAKALQRVNYDFDRIEAVYHTIIPLDPQNPDIFGKLGVEYYKRNRARDAVLSYRRALDINPAYEVNNEKFVMFVNDWLKRNSLND